MNKCVLVTGSTGMIGRALCSELRRQGFALRRLLRSGDVDEVESFHWDPLRGFLDPRVLEGVSAVVHLAGEPIAQRWNNQAKARILASRIRSTEVLVEAMRLAESTADFIVSSGINFYGSNAGRITEGEADWRGESEGFLSDVCHRWEAKAKVIHELGNYQRCVLLRTGVVLHQRGGALKRMLPPFRIGLGGVVGSGNQWMSWIELADCVRIILWVLQSDYSGALNAVAPSPIQNKDFVKALSRHLGRPCIFPMPSWVVDALFGSMGRETVLADIGVTPQVLMEAGFEWEAPDIDSALEKALGND